MLPAGSSKDDLASADTEHFSSGGCVGNQLPGRAEERSRVRGLLSPSSTSRRSEDPAQVRSTGAAAHPSEVGAGPREGLGRGDQS